MRSSLLVAAAVALHIPGLACSIQHDTGGGQESYLNLLEEIETALGVEQRQAIEKRIRAIEAAMLPMFASMPMGDGERVGTSAARSVLDRWFMLRGWSVRGPPAGGGGEDAGEPESPAGILREHVPDGLHHAFEDQLGSRGLELREVAVIAATFKQLIRAETMQRLYAAYKANRIRPESDLDLEQVQGIFDAFMASLIAGRNITRMKSTEVKQLVQYTGRLYPFWKSSQIFVHTIQQRIIGRRKLRLPILERIAEEIGDGIGVWRKTECLKRKRELMAIEYQGSGRVRLADFYRLALHGGKPQFGESLEYLQHVGSLDDSDPSNLLVIIPNWVTSISNCFGGSPYYSICCISECEELLGGLERKFRSPSAAPADIAAFIKGLPPESVFAGQALPVPLVKHLEEIARNHSGRVPLHERPFALWMHKAYPRECPLPHDTPGATRPLRTDEWERTTGKEADASKEEMLGHIDERAELF